MIATSSASRSGAPTRRGRCRSSSAGVATLLALSLLPVLPVAGPAQAAVQIGTNISVFPDRDMVVAVGYEPGERLRIEVLRNDVVIGSAEGPAAETPEGVGLEVNHGPEGTPAPGDCWNDFTPDIIGGDVIRVTPVDRPTAGSDTMTVKDLAFNGPPVVEGDNAVSVSGTATPGLAFGVEFRRDKPAPRFRGAAGAPVFQGSSNVWKATYRMTEGTAGLTVEQQRNILLNEASWLAVAGGVGTETTLAELGEPGGVGPGCTGSADPNTIVGGLEPISIASGDVTFSGTAREGVPSVSVKVGGLEPRSATLSTNATGTKTWTLTVPKADLVAPAVPDGNVTVTPTYGSVAGASKTVLKDTVAPAAPTATPVPGTYPGTQHVALVKPDGEGTSTVHWEIGGAAVRDPDQLSAQYSTQIAVSSSQTIKARLFDAVGNAGAVATLAYRIGTPAGAPGGVTATAGNAQATVRWTAPTSSGDSAITGYVVRTYSGGTLVKETGVPTPTTSTTVGELTNGTAYTFAVAAVTAIGAGAFSSPSAPVTPAAADTTAPTISSSTPASGATGVSRTNNITVTFNEPVTGVVTCTTACANSNVRIKNLTSGSHWIATVAYDAATRTVTLNPDATLNADNPYEISLNVAATGTTTTRIRDAAGNQVAPTTFSFRTAPSSTTTTTVPGAPTGVSATAGNAEAAVRWTAPTSTGGSAITGYSVRTYSGSTLVKTETLTTTSTSTTVRGLTNGTAYSFAVAAINGVGTGSYSTPLSTAVTPTAGTPTTDTTAPTITGRTPAANATGVSRTANITVTFNEAVTGFDTTCTTVCSTSNFRIRNVSSGSFWNATVSYNASTRTATLNPAATLNPSWKYEILLNTTGTAATSTLIRDVAGNPLAGTRYTFTTGS